MDTPQKKKQPAPKSQTKPGPRTDWGEVAKWYDQLVGDQGSEYHQQVILPGILRLLPIENQKSEIKNPLNILDLACGQGVLCRKLASFGCHVTGLDAARMTVGNAGGIEVRLNGKPIGPIGKSGQVRVVVFTPDNFEVFPLDLPAAPSETL